MPDMEEQLQNLRNWAWLITALVLVILALMALLKSVVIVGPGERAVIFSRWSGVQPTQLAEGMHFIVPFLWVPTKYDVRTRTYTMGKGMEAAREYRVVIGGQPVDDPITCLTFEGLPAELDVSVRFHIDPSKVWRLHKEIGPDYTDKIVRPQTRSVVRMVVAKYPVIDLYSGRRQHIVEEITKRLTAKFQRNYIILDEVLVRDVRFPPEFQHAIEQKQVALQEAKRMDYVLEQARLERQRKIVEAEGEAKAVQLKAQALARNPHLIRYEYVKNLPNDLQIIIADTNTIISLRDLLEQSPQGRQQGGVAP